MNNVIVQAIPLKPHASIKADTPETPETPEFQENITFQETLGTILEEAKARDINSETIKTSGKELPLPCSEKCEDIVDIEAVNTNTVDITGIQYLPMMSENRQSPDISQKSEEHPKAALKEQWIIQSADPGSRDDESEIKPKFENIKQISSEEVLKQGDSTLSLSEKLEPAFVKGSDAEKNVTVFDLSRQSALPVQPGHSSPDAIKQPGQDIAQSPAPHFSRINTSLFKPEWVESFQGRVAWLVNEKVQTANIQLDPQELGPVHVEIKKTEEHTQITFTVNNAQVKELVESNLARLKDSFAASGEQVDVDVRQQDPKRQQDGREDAMNTRDETIEENEETLVSQIMDVRRGLLDYYI